MTILNTNLNEDVVNQTVNSLNKTETDTNKSGADPVNVFNDKAYNAFKIRVSVDRVMYHQKPKNEVGKIQERLKNAEVFEDTLEKLFYVIGLGCTIRPGILQGGNKKENWVGQQFFLVDIDNANDKEPLTTVDAALEICKKYHVYCNFYYYTFSHTEKLPKFRLGFVFDKEIKDEQTRIKVVEVLFKMFSQADKACKDPNRIFFGTNKGVNIVQSSQFNTVENFLNLHNQFFAETVKENTATSTKFERKLETKVTKTIVSNDDYKSEIEEIKRNFGFEKYLKERCGKHKVGIERIDFVICPICGHQNCFSYYPKTKSFNCFGANGKVGGDCFTFFQLTMGLNFKQAFEYIKYELLKYPKPVEVIQNLIDYVHNDEPSTDSIDSWENISSMDLLEMLSDDKNRSILFASTLKNKFVFNSSDGTWYYFNGKIWKEDGENCQIEKYAKDFVEQMIARLKQIPVGDNKDLAKKVKEVERYILKKSTRDTLIRDTKCENHIAQSEFDKDLNLLNCNNGTLNLNTREFKPHDPSDHMTKIAGGDYNPNADTSYFDNFVAEIMENDVEKKAFLQRCSGLSLTGETKDECFIILYGPTTRNGKSVFTNAIANALGDYAVCVNPESFVNAKFKNGSSASSDIVRLNGARLALSSEIPQNMYLDVALIKKFTGNDMILARALYKSEIEFKPRFKLIFNTNYLPQVTDMTLFDSNRVHVVTFNRHFSESEQDDCLKDKFSSPKMKTAILKWCLKGLDDYNKQGLNPPEVVKEAVREFKDYNDVINSYIESNFVEDETEFIKADAAYKDFNNWCTSQHRNIMGKHTFMQKLKEKNLLHTKDGLRNCIVGYRLLDTSSQMVF